jgi:hypothetical protein
VGLRVGLDVFRDEKFSEWIWKERVVVCDKGVAEDCNILRCDTVLLGEWFATLRRKISPSPSRPSSPKS